MLVDEDETIWMLERNVRAPELKKLRNLEWLFDSGRL